MIRQLKPIFRAVRRGLDQQGDDGTRQIELDEDHVDVLHELLLRGLQESDPAEREYAEAYDAFVEAAGYPLRIGDQPERIQDTWEKIVHDDGSSDRR